MIQVGSGNTGSGGAGGEFFWEFVAGLSGPIQLKAVNLVTGIETSYTLDPKNRLRLILNLIAFQRAVSLTESVGVGIQNDRALLIYRNTFTGLLFESQVDSAGIRQEASLGTLDARRIQSETVIRQDVDDSATGQQTEIYQDKLTLGSTALQAADIATNILTKDRNDDEVRDTVLNDGVRENRRFNLHETIISVGGLDVGSITIDPLQTQIVRDTAAGALTISMVEDGVAAGVDLFQFFLTSIAKNCSTIHGCFEDYTFSQYADDPLGANNRMQSKVRIDEAAIEFNDVKKFAIKSDGKIQTNQVVAGVHLVPNGNYIEIFNAAGASQGFLPLFT